MLSIVNIVARNWEQVTHGTAGVSGIPTTTTIWGALGWAMRGDGGSVGVSALAQSGSGCGPRARTSRPLARSVSPSPVSARSRFVVSAFFVGVAGALFGMFIGSFNPDAFFLNITFLMIVMLVIGGTTSLAGAVVGTIAISAVSELLRRIEGGVDLGLRSQVAGKPGLREIGLALVMLAILIFRPGGLTGGREIGWPFASARSVKVSDAMSRIVTLVCRRSPRSRLRACSRLVASGSAKRCERARS